MGKDKKINVSWERVSGPDLEPRHKERGIKNLAILKSAHFIKCCAAVGIEPTLRQASKYRRKMGLAFTAMRSVNVVG